jgi:hypothetical protein
MCRGDRERRVCAQKRSAAATKQHQASNPSAGAARRRAGPPAAARSFPSSHCFSLLFCSRFQVNKTLKSLNLGGNSIGAEGAEAIAAALRVLEISRSLSPRRARAFFSLSSHPFSAVFFLLQHNEALTTLSFGWNHIGDNGASAIAAALQVIST